MTKTVRWTDTVGVCGAVFAALCCMGVPVIVSVLAAVGLGWLRQDAILWPLMVVSLAIAGVIFVHGPPARVLIDTTAVALVLATAWNVWLRKPRPAVAVESR
ncbi:MAG TPA: hypothetical protein VHR41_18965 [Gemmatimonadales bacterium]|nr:hypothetical protein [Gemmatimonadales bacterium]